MKLEDIGSEYRGAVLGDRRRSERLERIAAGLARNPGLSFPEAMGSEGQLEGLYRFLNNDEVTFEAVHAPEGLGRIHDAGAASGFWLHASLAVTPTRTPLGVLAAPARHERAAAGPAGLGRAARCGCLRRRTLESMARRLFAEAARAGQTRSGTDYAFGDNSR